MRMPSLVVVLALSMVQGAVSTKPRVGVWYAGPGVTPPATRLDDPGAIGNQLARIRRAGFSAITTWVTWAESERTRGSLTLGPTERLIAAAGDAGLDVSVVVYDTPGPAWAAAAGPSARIRFVADVEARLGSQRGVVDVVDAAAVEKSRRRITVGASGVSAPRARLGFWEAIASGATDVGFLSGTGSIEAVLPLGETAGVVARNPALFASLRPRKGGVASISGSGGAPVDVKLLESADALMIVGLNYSPSPQKVRIAFDPDLPEAIWQNLETGAAVNFVMGPRGPVYEYTFAPHDTLVLMIRKKLR